MLLIVLTVYSRGKHTRRLQKNEICNFFGRPPFASSNIHEKSSSILYINKRRYA